MSVEEILLDAEERMEKALTKLKQDLTGIRTGRASPGMVDSLRVEAYGSPVPIKQIASVSAPEPQQLVIRPFDPGTIKDIEKGIIASDLGLAPQSDARWSPAPRNWPRKRRSPSATSAATPTSRPNRKRRTRTSPKTNAIQR